MLLFYFFFFFFFFLGGGVMVGSKKALVVYEKEFYRWLLNVDSNNWEWVYEYITHTCV